MNTVRARFSSDQQISQSQQSKIWQGEFGRTYSDRNIFEPSDLDSLWLTNYGVSRSEINRTFLESLPKTASILEIGCNVGNQLLMLQTQGYTKLTGVEIQSYALNVAKSRLAHVTLEKASALRLPFEDRSFDLVFTSGVLIHIAPEDLPNAMSEIHRCAKRYIWGAEYFSKEPASVNYRGHDELLWKMDYARLYLSLFGELELVREKRLPYLCGENVDSVFLLKTGNANRRRQ